MGQEAEESHAATPLEWSEHGLVVLAGAGVSIAAPANVPSWWQFNQAVLDALKRRFLAGASVPARATRPLEHLSLDRLDVNEFSLVVHNAFAGPAWFDLLRVLDGEAPNITHSTLGALAEGGALRGVVTTNFDTLFERSLPPSFVRSNVLLQEPPVKTRPFLVKLHGTAGVAGSLIDLAQQKRRGLPQAWRDWLRDTFARHCVLVLGFSGADLRHRDDYLGLQSAALATPWLGWNARTGESLHPQAAEIVATCGDRGHVVAGDLPNALAKLGVSLAEAGTGASQARRRLTIAVDQWAGEADGDFCGVALERLLGLAGARYAAQALRSSLRTRTRRNLRRGLNLSSALHASLVLGQLGIDGEDFEQAFKDLDLAERALDAVVGHLRQRREGMSSASETEYARAMCNIVHAKAQLFLKRGDVASAQQQMEKAEMLIESLPEAARSDRMPARWQNLGAIAWLQGDRMGAEKLFERAHAAAVEAGDLSFTNSTQLTLDRMKALPAEKLVKGLRRPLYGSEWEHPLRQRFALSSFMGPGGLRLNRQARVEALRKALAQRRRA